MQELSANGLLAAAGVMLAGTAGAAPWVLSGPLADWVASGGETGVVVDGDGDTACALFGATDIPTVGTATSRSRRWSFDGAHHPLVGYARFAGRTKFGVQQIFQSSAAGVFDDAHASFVVSVPQPAPAALVGVALLALTLTRRSGAEPPARTRGCTHREGLRLKEASTAIAARQVG